MTLDTNSSGSTRLVRVQRGAIIAGVCAGIAQRFGFDPSLVRLAYILLTVASVGFPGVLVYLILWAVVPREGSATT
jgi:phage shock protein PspC (stress-responsive transcriptional regulator)